MGSISYVAVTRAISCALAYWQTPWRICAHIYSREDSWKSFQRR
jgi:hypothetical protein